MDSKFYCETLFGPRTSDRRNVFNFSMLFSMVVLNACGIAANVLIHRSVSVWNKAWGLVVANAIYVTEIVLVIVLIVNLHSGDNFWPLKLMMWYMLLVMCSMWLTGLIFAQNLVVFLTCVIVYYSCTFGVASEMQLNSGNNVIAELDSLLTTSLYAGTSHFLLFIHLAMLASSYMNEKASRKRFFQRLVITYQQDKIIQEKGKQEKLQKKLLFNMLPKSIVGKLEMGLKISQRHQGVCILFAELEGFAAFSSQVHPSGVMEYLNDLFQVFDGLCDSYDVYKVETVGDQYVAAVGVVTGCMHNEEVDAEGDSRGGSMDWESSLHASSASNTQQMIGFAKAIMEGFKLVSLPESEVSPALRIGIHTGPCMSGIVGTKSLRFCLFGDTMNTAARMEQKGTAACVHTTQDVVDLVPGERWEKLAKMEVKGKGSMQTYLLRLPAMADEEFEGGDNIASVVASVSKREYENPFFLQSKDDDGSDRLEEVSSAERLDVGSGPSVYQDIQPVSDAVYAEHTKWFGLCFKKLHVERAFLDGQARQGKIIVFVGYGLYVLLMLSNYLKGYVEYYYQTKWCRTSEILCLFLFGPASYEAAQSDGKVTYDMVASYAVYNMNEYLSFAVLILLVLACVVHVVIHRVAAIEKWWATVVVAAVYTLLLTGMLISAAAYGRLRVESGSGQWVTSIEFVMINLSTLMSFFTDAPFLGHFLWWFVATALYYGLGVTTIDATVKIDESYNAIRNGADAVSGCVLLTMYSIILLFGSCLRDKSNRKQFLQRVLMVKQQNQIIREKSRNERMQRHFLENILPASVVEKLQLQQEQWSLQLQHDKIQTSSISQRHFGVGILYADLVGFTSFCKQVDPFSVMVFLNDLFEVFDGLCDDFNVYKVETVGDCYVATVGVVTGEQHFMAVDAPTPNSPQPLLDSMVNAKFPLEFIFVL